MKTFSITYVIALLIVIVTHAPDASAAAGRTVGSFAVSPTGSATYTIPIWAAPGPHGLQPNIALTYDSRQGSGYVGIGWGVSGLSSISRCNKTYAQDTAPAPVTLTYNDAFCLDGKRLRLTSSETLSTYGQAGTTYQTEIADFSNITANGTAGNGPASFTVQARDGNTYEYGNTANSPYSQVLATDSSTASAWMLDKVTDRAGNTMLIRYVAPSSTLTGATVPCTISWTPATAGSASYNYTMTFAYTTNLPQSSISAYVAGTSILNQDLLTSITITYSGTAVKQYAFTYDTSPTTGGYRLQQVKECADATQSNCLLPTTVTYQNGSAGIAPSATAAISNASNLVYATYDFNGDDIDDLAYCDFATSKYFVAFGSISGTYGAPVNTGAGCPSTIADLLGTGRMGILSAPSYPGNWYYYSWNGSAFTSVSTGLAYNAKNTQFSLLDINGDGLPDLVSVLAGSNSGLPGGQAKIYANVNTSSGSTPSFAAQSTLYTYNQPYGTNIEIATLFTITDSPQGGTRNTLDFNGDGIADIGLSIYLVDTGYYLVHLISNGSGGYTPTVVSADPNAGIKYFNFNSDACTDYLVGTTIYLSGCNGSPGNTLDIGSISILALMDWDGDGRTDILVQNGTTIGVYLSTGTGLNLITTSVPFSDTGLYKTFDANGDGLDDLLYYNYSDKSISYFAHNSAGQPPDLISSISDGYGNSASPTYTSISRGSYTTNAAVLPSFPYTPYAGPEYVVNQVTYSDPSSSTGATYYENFTYSGMWMNLQGRGLTSFQTYQRYDSRNQLWEKFGYENVFPYDGNLIGDTLSKDQAATQPIRSVTQTHALTTLDGTANNQRYFPYNGTSSTSNYEVGGTEDGQLITNTSATYSFDNYGNATNTTYTVTDKDPNSPKLNISWATSTTNTPDVDTSHWCLTLLTQKQIAYTATDSSAPVTRTISYTSPDTVNCRYTHAVTEPGNATYQVTEALGYDSFGNINSDTVTGVNMTPRQTATDWGATGQFPANSTDALGNVSIYGYNFGLGVRTSVTDPNGLITSWTPDGFGRTTLETRPDGTYTVTTYSDCAASGGCLVGNHALEVASVIHNSDNSVQTDGTEYLDTVDRALVSSKRLLAPGAYDRREQRYDSLGNVLKQSMPCVWSSLSTQCPYWSTILYDSLGRPTQVQRPQSALINTPQSTVIQYAGRSTVVTDPQGIQSTQVRGVKGTLLRTKDNSGFYETLSYDAFGSLVGVTDSLGHSLFSASYDYGIGAFQKTSTDADSGARSKTYDALGELVYYTDAKGQSFTTGYDAASRPVLRTEPDLITSWTWGNSAASHNIGKLQQVCAGPYSGTFSCSGNYTETQDYDGLGRPQTRTVAIPSDGIYHYDYSYSPTTGQLDTLSYPISTSAYRLALKYSYQNGLLQDIADANVPATHFWTASATDARGHVTLESLGNGVLTHRSFDDVTGWINSLQSGKGGGAALQNESYLFDMVGNLTERQNGNTGVTEDFYYDNAYRLDHSKLNGGINLQMAYDATGNITSRSDMAAGATWTYDPVRIHAATQSGSGAYTYTYDANGNVTARNGSTITWSSYNHPLTLSTPSESVQFAYNQNHERWSTVYSGSTGVETTYSIGGLLEKVVTVGGVADYRHYIYAAGTKVAVYSRVTTGSNTLRYVREDHLGGASCLLDDAGNSYVKESFTAFGSRRNTCTWSGAPTSGQLQLMNAATRKGFTWQTALGNMGLNDFNGRIQDSISGRFLSPDPGVPDPTNTQSYNRYSYVNNNPLSRLDPTGFGDDPLSEVLLTGTNQPVVDDVMYSGYNATTYVLLASQTQAIDSVSTAAMMAEAAQNAVTVKGTKAKPPPTSIACSGRRCPSPAPGFWDTHGFVYNAIGLGAMECFFNIGSQYACGSGRFAKEGVNVAAAIIPGVLEIRGAAGAAKATSVFWSGPGTRTAAEAWAAANGGATLSVAADATMDDIIDASADFAAQATGNVVVFQNSVRGVVGDGIWAQTEFGVLMSNPNVTGITYNMVDESGAMVCSIFCPK